MNTLFSRYVSKRARWGISKTSDAPAILGNNDYDQSESITHDYVGSDCNNFADKAVDSDMSDATNNEAVDSDM